jgi:hypothetical protein
MQAKLVDSIYACRRLDLRNQVRRLRALALRGGSDLTPSIGRTFKCKIVVLGRADPNLNWKIMLLYPTEPEASEFYLDTLSVSPRCQGKARNELVASLCA